MEVLNMENKPRSINQLQRVAKDNTNGGKFVIVPTNFKKFKKNDKEVNLPTDAEIKTLNR